MNSHEQPLGTASGAEQEIFSQALDLTSADEREAFLDRACGSNRPLRQRVEQLLALHQDAGDFLAGDAQPMNAALSGPSDAAARLEESPGSRIGRFQILQKLGEGGFGVVYLAEQREPVKRRVALKIIKVGMDTKQVVARFEGERQALAIMEHPNIARVLDGGATETGRPYFVMELVRGVPITQYCDDHQLSTKERLRLFVEVCGAIQHAHQKGIIHRDIKPSNVMVTLHDRVPVPKVIDFGVAKATQQELAGRTIFTRHHEFIGTPAYMSPEQAAMSALDVDTRTDIYSLGVLLYELLTGTTPFDAEDMLSGGYESLRRHIREVDPVRPSSRANTLSAEQSDRLARQRRTDPRRLRHLLQGDLDWIVIKALEKDRSRRYESAGAFAQDIARYLNDEPVVAAAPSVAYKMRKFVRRHRTLVAVTTVMLIFLGASTGVSTALAIRAARAEHKARQEAEVTAAINQFLNDDLFGQSDPNRRSERELTARTMLDRAARAVRERFRGRPQVEAAIELTLGRLYQRLDGPAKAQLHLRRAFELYFHEVGENDPRTIEALGLLAGTAAARRQSEEARQLADRALELARRTLGESHPDWVKHLALHADVCYRTGDGEQAYLSSKAAVEAAERIAGVKTEHHARALMVYGRRLGARGRRDEGEASLRKALDLTVADAGPHSYRTLLARNNLAAYLYDHRYQLDEAEQLYLQALDQAGTLLGESHSTSRMVRGNLIHLYRTRQRPDRAAGLLIRQLEFGDPAKDANWLELVPEFLSQGAFVDPNDESAAPPTIRIQQERPLVGWQQNDFNDEGWSVDPVEGPGPVWLRTTLDLQPSSAGKLLLLLAENLENPTAFVNGEPIDPVYLRQGDGWAVFLPSERWVASIRPGPNVLAIHGRLAAGRATPSLRLLECADPPPPTPPAANANPDLGFSANPDRL